jgi:phosphocarrier protein FPr
LFTEQKPSLELQTKSYKEIFDVFSDVTVRTLDIGGDKALPYINLPKEDNPFLGVRGIRLLQTHPELLAEQLQAIFMAAMNTPIKIMFPMISSVDEFTDAKNFAKEVAKKHNIVIDNILFGMMIEVPSVLFSLPEFDKVVDFYSVGTNDLTQYLFAIERTHPTLKTDALSPVIFTVLKNIVNSVTKPVSICGELASHTEAISKLVQMGYTTLSVTAKSIPKTKEIIRHV